LVGTACKGPLDLCQYSQNPYYHGKGFFKGHSREPSRTLGGVIVGLFKVGGASISTMIWRLSQGGDEVK